MRILITGAAGHIGSALVYRIMKDTQWEILAVDNLRYNNGYAIIPFLSECRVQFFNQDVRDMDFNPLLDKADVAVNLSALVGEPICRQYEQEAYDVNTKAALRLAQSCEAKKKPLITSSTCSNYGTSIDYAKEGDQLFPVSHYAKTKVEMETKMLETMPDLHVTLLRFATAYGFSFRNRYDLMLQEFVRDAFFAKKISLYGSSFFRPMCHVDDIARAIVRTIMELWNVPLQKDIFNVGSTEHNFTKRQIAEMVQARLPCEIVEQGGKVDPRNYKVSFDKFKRQFGFTAAHSPEEAIDQLATALECGLVTREMMLAQVNMRS